MSVDRTVTEYLGIGIEEVRTDKRRLGYKLTQEGIIKKTLSTTVITDCNVKATPTSGEAPLGINLDGDPDRYQTKCLYDSIIGMMMHLDSNSRPEIQFAVHKCAQFNQNYRASHEDAIISIWRYLKDTKKGANN